MKDSSSIIAAIIIAFGMIVAAIIFAGASGGGGGAGNTAPANNVSIVDGKQIVEIRAKGGYQPRFSNAKAGVPTILRINTNGTFDCSAIVRIPSLNIGKVLPQTGTTDIDLGSQPAGSLVGTCGMGMYPFEIDFQK